MATELIITSVPKGLKPGSYGFCTAACTKDLNEPTSRALEVISGYRHLFSSEEGKANPVAFSYLLYEFAGRQRRVLSRVADMGLDYSGRTNKIAHHLVLSEDEKAKCDAGPAALCAGGVFMERWPEDEQPHYLDARTVFCVESINLNAIKTGAWQKLTGDPGWAGVLAGTVLTRRPVVLIVRPEQDVLTLFREALVLLKPEERWKATFSTYYTSLPANAQCQWRALVDGAYDEKLLRNQNALTLDLRKPGVMPRIDETTLTPQEKPLVDLARGVASARAEAPQSWEPLGLTPEEAPKSRAPGRGPNPLDRKDNVFFGSVDNGDNSTLGEGYKPDGSTGVSYMPPSHKKSGMIWVLIGFLAGLVILAIVALALWFTVGNKKDGGGSVPPAETGAQGSSHSGAETSGKENPPANPKKPKTKESVPQVVINGQNKEEGQASENKLESTKPQDPEVDEDVSSQKEEPNEAETGEADNPPNAESEKRTANPVLKLEEQWNKLKEEKNFDRTVRFVEGQRSDIDSLYEDLNGNISTSKTFLKNYDERKSEEIDSISDLCDQIADAQTAADYLANKFDIELFQKKCEVAVQGMEQIITLYNEAFSDKELENWSFTLRGMNGALKAHFAEVKSTNSDDKSDDAKKDEEIENLAGGLTPIRDEIDSIYQRSKKEFVEDLNAIKPRASEFPEMRRVLEKEIMVFIVQTVNSENSFSTFTKNLKGVRKVPVKFGETKYELFSWDSVGDDKNTSFGKGLEAYVKHFDVSQDIWTCYLTFAFNKTDEIDALEKKVEFVPGSKDGVVFSVDVNGKTVSLGVKMSSKDGRLGSLDFYTSDPNSIPAILHSARVCISFISKSDPESTGFKSEFCQLLKPVDMTKTADIEADEFLTSCEYITEADEDLSNNKAFCVVTCDKSGKNEGGETLSAKLKLRGVNTSDDTSESDETKKIELIVSRSFSLTEEATDVTYVGTFSHSLLRPLGNTSKSYQDLDSWRYRWELKFDSFDVNSLNEDRKDPTAEAQKQKIMNSIEEESYKLLQEEYGTGNLLFYLVYPGYDVPRENWILYGKAPYRVMILSDGNNDQNQTDDQTNSK